ncbi:hypothetical protein K3X44_13115 [Aliiroseovarius crassostreae]|uniref:hypothetical protein n=1 Tax=Aliiroseovarius crassostreae TaxID=154981 RepID=UPI002201EEF9|nr:hypothetical protein [Aliiroseovarius crassostreae]UWQ01397.1 hypothetical protein K3X44_13115 [Aliiroseovarius crassostreae]
MKYPIGKIKPLPNRGSGIGVKSGRNVNFLAFCGWKKAWARKTKRLRRQSWGVRCWWGELVKPPYQIWNLSIEIWTDFRSNDHGNMAGFGQICGIGRN